MSAILPDLGRIFHQTKYPAYPAKGAFVGEVYPEYTYRLLINSWDQLAEATNLTAPATAREADRVMGYGFFLQTTSPDFFGYHGTSCLPSSQTFFCSRPGRG